MEPGGKIAVRAYGSPANPGPVVVLHGGPGAPGSAVGLARCLSRDFRVLEPLQRTAGSYPLSVSRHVNELLAVLPPNAVLVGWSWGAMLGLSFAARHPGQLTALVLVGCGTYDAQSRARLKERLRQCLDGEGQKRLASLRQTLGASPDPESGGRLLAEMGRLIAQASSYDDLQDRSEPLPVDYTGHAQTWAGVLRLQEEGIEPRIFHNIRVPVLMVHGEVDPHPGRETRDLLRRHVADLEYHELPRCGHQPWNERHANEAFLDLISGWIAQYAGSPLTDA